jgi:uncharacterized protein with HEPN domain
MQHDPYVCIEDAVKACKLIISFTEDMTKEEFSNDLKTKSAVERQFEIIGESLNRIKKIDKNLLKNITNWQHIIGFRNVIAHGYDVVDDIIIWNTLEQDIPLLLNQLENLI